MSKKAKRGRKNNTKQYYPPKNAKTVKTVTNFDKPTGKPRTMTIQTRQATSIANRTQDVSTSVIAAAAHKNANALNDKRKKTTPEDKDSDNDDDDYSWHLLNEDGEFIQNDIDHLQKQLQELKKKIDQGGVSAPKSKAPQKFGLKKDAEFDFITKDQTLNDTEFEVESSCESIRSEINRVTHECEELSSARIEIASLKISCEKVKNCLKGYQRNNSHLKAERENFKTEIAHLKDIIVSKDQKNKSLMRQLNDQNDEMARTQDILSTTKEENKYFSETLKAQNSEIAHLKKALTTKNDRIRMLENENSISKKTDSYNHYSNSATYYSSNPKYESYTKSQSNSKYEPYHKYGPRKYDSNKYNSDKYNSHDKFEPKKYEYN